MKGWKGVLEFNICQSDAISGFGVFCLFVCFYELKTLDVAGDSRRESEGFRSVHDD